MRHTIVIIAAIAYVTPSFGAGCDDVYLNNVRTRTFTEANYASLNTLYDHLCMSSTSKKSLSWDASMSIIIESIPINMTGKGKSDEEKADAFCRTYNTLRFDASHSALANDEVVTSALDAYNACKEIEARTGVVVTHKFADPDSILVNFDFKNSTTFLRIDGVLANNMTCRANSAPKGEESLGPKSHFSMTSNFAITCARTHPNSDKSQYVAGSLAIGTNVTSYAISLPADSIYNNSLASDTTAKIDGLQQALTAAQGQTTELNKKLSEANKKIDGIRMVQHRIMVGEKNPGGGFEFYSCGAHLDQIQDSLCKGAAQASTTPGNNVKAGGCGDQDLVITCLFLGQ